MPQHAASAARRTPPHGKLVKDLVRELLTPTPGRIQPFILDRKHPQGPHFVDVVWDRFRRVSWDDRPNAIIRAYEIAFGAEVGAVVNPLGYLPVEGVKANFFPWRVRPDIAEFAPLPEEYRPAFAAEAALTVQGARAPDLRYPAREAAAAAAARLAGLWPDAGWHAEYQIIGFDSD